MNTKNIPTRGKLFGLLLAVLLMISTIFGAPTYRANAMPEARYNPARAAVFTPPTYCPNPAIQPNAVSLFSDDMESGAAKWTFGANGAFTSDWSIVTADVSSPTHALSGPDESFKNDSYAAMSSDVTIEAGATYLYFSHKYDFEAQNAEEGYDGGVLEYSTDMGVTWKTDVETFFSAGQNYNSTLKYGYQNPLETRKAFSATSDGVVATRYDLTPLTGQTVRFRWRTGSDTNNDSGAFSGWFVDDVRIYTCQTQVNSITRVNPSPTNLSSVGFTVTFSRSVTGVDTTGPTFDDFSLTTTSLTGASIESVTGSGTTYTVSVNTGAGNGTVRLDVGTSGHIIDTLGNPLGAGFTSGEVYSVLKSNVFTDVPPTYWARDYIERLYIWKITGGCNTNPMMYCPEALVTRAQMAIFLLRGMKGSSYTPPAASGATFSDVSASYWAAAWIENLASEGITLGCGGGKYCPEASVTRAQMAVFLLRSEHGSTYVPPVPTGVFIDVPPSYWAAGWIEQLATEKITSGCGANTYCPESPVNRAQMAVFLVRAFKLP